MSTENPLAAVHQYIDGFNKGDRTVDVGDVRRPGIDS